MSIGDQHVDSMAPSSRKDDYYESIQKKLLEIRELSVTLNVDGLIFLGDLLHKQDGHRVPYFVTNWLLEYFDGFPKDKRKFLVQGNHDVKANAANWRRQPIGTLVTAGVVEALWDDPSSENPHGAKSIAISDGQLNVSIGGRVFSYEADTAELRPTYYSRTSSDDSFHILGCHSALVPVGCQVFGHYSTIEDVFNAVPESARPGLYLCGHLHEYYGVFDYGDAKCMNLGSLSRGSIDEYNLTRQVKVGLIDVTKHNDAVKVKLDEVVLKSVKPADEVFLIDAIQYQKKRSIELEQLASMLSQDSLTSQFKLLNPDDALELIMKQHQVSDDVRKLLNELVTQTRQELA